MVHAVLRKTFFDKKDPTRDYTEHPKLTHFSTFRRIRATTADLWRTREQRRICLGRVNKGVSAF
ncbi:Sterigmatocystin biosynthesis fatty acid synthase subunit alpha [Frankliniella fusca]|uniref:Sterigmatocystin biosynthesis fatty acid synthase subunit alpha n=1 Tax=Frankliniella fusca TaxID=407009 RepID=A0AAE1HSF1_9NEOP|nr:Sterigmatocystin biosynthesis fatty acid synthase subunit alpha [Frankliniella fusca]